MHKSADSRNHRSMGIKGRRATACLDWMQLVVHCHWSMNRDFVLGWSWVKWPTSALLWQQSPIIATTCNGCVYLNLSNYLKLKLETKKRRAQEGRRRFLFLISVGVARISPMICLFSQLRMNLLDKAARAGTSGRVPSPAWADTASVLIGWLWHVDADTVTVSLQYLSHVAMII